MTRPAIRSATRASLISVVIASSAAAREIMQKTYTKPAGSECGGSDAAAFGP